MNPAKYKTLVAIIAVLLLSNVAMLIYFMGWKDSGKSAHGDKRKSPMSEFLQKEIGFSQQQMNLFDSLKQQQKASVKPLFEDLSKSRDSLYQLISAASVNDSVQQAANVIGRKQAALELKMFDNLRRIRAVCTPEQLPKFDSLAPSLVRKMMSPSRRQGPPSKGDSSRGDNRQR